MRTDDLAEWLRLQVDEDERGALAAVEQHWRPDGADSCQVYAARDDGSNRTIAWCRNGYEDDFANSLHIARWDPARVLREVDAKRKILDDHEPVVDGTQSSWKWFEGSESESEQILRLLALPYSDRPGYLEAWRP